MCLFEIDIIEIIVVLSSKMQKLGQQQLFGTKNRRILEKILEKILKKIHSFFQFLVRLRAPLYKIYIHIIVYEYRLYYIFI